LESDVFRTLNTRYLLLIGAGASKPLGMPLMKEFEALLNVKVGKEERECLRKLWLIHAEETNGATFDLEALLALIERYRGFYNILFGDKEFGYIADKEEKRRLEYEYQGLLNVDSARPPSYLAEAFARRSVFENLDGLVRDLVFETYGKDLNEDRLEELYSPLFETVNRYFSRDVIPIFTTNYDMAIETYAKQGDAHLEMGFESTPTSSEWRPGRFYRFQPAANKMNMMFFKLHGSLAWHRSGNVIVQTGLPVRDPSGFKSVVLYPTQTKEYPDEEPFRTAYSFLRGCFTVARLVIAIGYSFRDPGIHRIMAESLELNPDLFFVLICGSNIEHWKTFAQAHLGKHHIIPYYFEFGSDGASYLSEMSTVLGQLRL